MTYDQGFKNVILILLVMVTRPANYDHDIS